MFFRRLVKRSVWAEALARGGGWARNDGELGSMRRDDLRFDVSFSRSGLKYVRQSCVTQRWRDGRRVRGRGDVIGAGRSARSARKNMPTLELSSAIVATGTESDNYSESEETGYKFASRGVSKYVLKYFCIYGNVDLLT